MNVRQWHCEGHRKNGIEFAIRPGQAGRTYRILGMRLCYRCEKIATEYVRSRGRQVLDMTTPMQSGDLVGMYGRAIKECITKQKVSAILLNLVSDQRASATAANIVNKIARDKIKEIEKETSPMTYAR